MKFVPFSILISVLLPASLLTACAVGPDYARPGNSAALHKQYLNADDAVYDGQPISRWWTRLEDPLIHDYVDQLLDQNLELKQAAERVIQARQNVRIAGADLFPTLGAEAGGRRGFTPGQSFEASGQNIQSGLPSLEQDRRYNTSYDASLNTSWELDLFGRIRRARESASAVFEAARYDNQALTHSLIAELFNRRVAIATNAALLDLARQNLDNRKAFYELVKRRYNLGTGASNAANVYLAEQTYKDVQGDVNLYSRLLAEERYRFDVLLGLLPGTTQGQAEDFPVLPPPRDIAVCLPADLLDRRPDLRASELRVKAANADIGVAIANLYPNVSLGGTLGFTGDTTNDLFTAQNLAGSLLASITARIFEGGRLRANIALQESEAREHAAAYAENVLNAIREVESALKAEQELQSEWEAQNASIKALKKAESISKGRYERGIESLQNYLDTRQSLYIRQQALYSKQQELWNTRIALLLALGGDWLEPETKTLDCRTRGETNE